MFVVSVSLVGGKVVEYDVASVEKARDDVGKIAKEGFRYWDETKQKDTGVRASDILKVRWSRKG